MDRQLSLEQKQFLYSNGYIVIKNAVSDDLVSSALSRIKSAKKGENLSVEKSMTDLVNASSITPVLNEVMGQFDPPQAAQIGVLKKRQPGDHYNNLGYKDKDMPYYGTELHMDGNITIATPQTIQQGAAEQIYNRYIRSGPKGDLGRSAEVMGHNYTPLFQDPQMTLGLGSFTAFVFVCLNDQSKPGCGQTSLLPGAHHLTEKFFQRREAGGRVVDRCMQMFGGLGVAKDLPFERWFREMRIRRIGEGPSEVQRHIIARELLGSSLR